MKTLSAATIGVFGLLLGACAHDPEQPDPFVGWYKDYRTCRAEYAEFDARVAAAGVGDATYYRVPGYPYLRTDRTLASFAHEVQSLDEVGGWIRRMRENDQEAREFEYINLGMSKQEAANQRARFLNCGRTLAGFEFVDQPVAYGKLLELAQPKDDYDGVQRALGAYALVKPRLRGQVEAQQKALDARYAQPLSQLAGATPRVLWSAKAEADLSLVTNVYAKVFPDELGFPGLTDSQWRALAEHHAPQLWVPAASESDQPALPVLTADGSVSADPAQPHVHYHITFTRFGGQPLVQINYLFWFKGASQQAPLDGLIWRVTLDDQAQPMVFESLHTSGRDHRWYPVQTLARRAPQADEKGIPVIAPQAAPALQPTLLLEAGTHRVLRVIEAAQAQPAQAARVFEIHRYDDLLTLPLPGGGSRSLFGPTGFVRGPHADDPQASFASGIREPGALRQLGHHPITPVGRAHFDEPFLMEAVFVPAKVKTRQAAQADVPPG